MVVELEASKPGVRGERLMKRMTGGEICLTFQPVLSARSRLPGTTNYMNEVDWGGEILRGKSGGLTD